MGKNLEVINLGASGHGSTRVSQIMKEALGYSPDLLVVYTGQNEFRDAYFHAKELLRPKTVATIMEVLFASRAVFGRSFRQENLKEALRHGLKAVQLND